MVDRWFLELTRASIGNCRVLCFNGNLRFRNTDSILRREQSFQRDEESACGRSSSETTGRQGALLYSVLLETPPAESAAKKRQCIRNHRPCKRKDCATRAKARGEASLEVGGEPKGYSNITC